MNLTKRTFGQRIRSGGTVSWQHPAVRATLPIIDRADRALREIQGRSSIPKYSDRIRSNGMNRQFGGSRFLESGRADLIGLLLNALVTPTSDIIDIGCGVGRLATALTMSGVTGTYLGLDTDLPSVQSCQRNPLFKDDRFTFKHVDIASDVYNQDGSLDAATVALPVPSGEADLVIGLSLFTHLYKDECANYANEMIRALRPGGAVVVSVFLVDPTKTDGRFPIKTDDGYIRTSKAPRKAIGHTEENVTSWFGSASVQLLKDSKAPRTQDWVIVRP